MNYRLIREDAYFQQGILWVEIGRYDTPRDAIRAAEKERYESATRWELPNENYHLNMTMFWVSNLFGGCRSYHLMHHRPYTSPYVVVPASIEALKALIYT